MPQQDVPMFPVPVDVLNPYITRVLRGMSADDAEAGIVAANLLDANLAGHDSHGIGMIPKYHASFKEGYLKAGQHASVAKDTGPVMVFDGHMGYGQVIGREVTEQAIARARENGFVLAALRGAHHIGRIGAWGEMCAEAGLVSVHYVNGYSNMIVAPFGGTDARYGTNPYCTAIPGIDGEPPIILDMATTRIAMGKVRVAYNAGKPVPGDSLIDSRGQPTTDPAVMFEEPTGALISFAQHKGYGLSMVCDMLGGGLTGGGTGLPHRNKSPRIVNNMFMMIMTPGLFDDADAVMADIQAFRQHVLASPPADGVDAVMMPGEPERKSRAQRRRDGVPVDLNTWNLIAGVAGEMGVDVPDVEPSAAAD